MVRLILPVPFFPLFPFPLKGGREKTGMGNPGKSRNEKKREKTGTPNKTETRPNPDRENFTFSLLEHQTC